MDSVSEKQISFLYHIHETSIIRLQKNNNKIFLFISDRDVQHNISQSTFNRNNEGALSYYSAGEVNPIITVEKNQFTDNCNKLYGNFTSCESSIDMDIQNTQTFYFRVSDIENAHMEKKL